MKRIGRSTARKQEESGRAAALARDREPLKRQAAKARQKEGGRSSGKGSCKSPRAFKGESLEKDAKADDLSWECPVCSSGPPRKHQQECRHKLVLLAKLLHGGLVPESTMPPDWMPKALAGAAQFNREQNEAYLKTRSPEEARSVRLQSQREQARPKWRAQIEKALEQAETIYAKLTPEQQGKVKHPHQVRWWANRYCAPVLLLAERDIDGRLHVLGEPAMGPGGMDAVLISTTRQRRRSKEIAAAIVAYFRHAAGDSYAKIAGTRLYREGEGSDDTPRKNVDWLASQLDAVPIAVEQQEDKV